MNNFCPHCGHCLNPETITAAAPIESNDEGTTSLMDGDAVTALKKKMREIAATFDEMSQDEFDRWIDALTLPEFIELLRLGNEGFGGLVAQLRDEFCNTPTAHATLS